MTKQKKIKKTDQHITKYELKTTDQRMTKSESKLEEKNIKVKPSIKKRILPTILIAFVIPFMICFSVPFDIYGNNIDEFLFTVSGFLPVLVLYVLIFTAIFFFSLLFLPNKAYRIASSVFISLGFMFFIQGTYLNGTMSSLAGDNLGVSKIAASKQVFNLILWIVIVAAGIVLAILKDKKGIFSTGAIIVAVIVVATQIMTPVSIALTNKKLFLSIDERLKMSDENSVHSILTNKNLTDISKSNNIFYFCIDRFDERFAEDAIKKYPKIYDELTGFTWFQDHISLYGHTYPAIANMLTRKEFDPEKLPLREEFLNGAYDDNDTLSLLKDNGYSINLYTQNYYAFVDATYLPDYVSNKAEVKHYKVKRSFRLALKMVEMSLFRCVPLVLKNVFGDVNSSTCNELIEEQDINGNEKFSLDLRNTYNFVSNSEFKSVDNKVFNFMHVDGCHQVVYNENWKKTFSGDITVTVKSSFDIINLYLKAMKEAGVYDNATIIITGDHAHPVDDFNKLNDSRLTALFVKPAKSSNEALKISKAQTSHDNLWATILKSENLINDDSYGKSVFEIPENEDQTRRYIWHTYMSPLDEYIYEIKGDGKDFENWSLKTHNHYEKRFIMD